MRFKSRKFFIWLVSLAAVLAIYLLCGRLSKTSQIDTFTAKQHTDTVPDTNAGQFGGEVGTVGNIEIGTVRKAKYIHLNEDQEIDREFGFEKLLHEEGDLWEIAKPYMNIFRPRFICYITADNGTVRVETTAGRPSPKDATLIGNVVIHIVPKASSDIGESFIYLDDLIFISERWQFSTDGPLKFAAQNAHMLAKGLRLVYNDDLDRLEYVRIIHLETLRLKTPPNASLFSSQESPMAAPAAKDSDKPAEHPAPPVTPVTSQKQKPPLPTSRQAAKKTRDQYHNYRCLFSKNVVIDSPDQLVYAEDQLLITDILWQKVSSDKSDSPDANGTGTPKEPSQVTEGNVPPAPGEADLLASDDSLPAVKHPEPNEATDQLVDIVVTCDNGMLLTPADSPKVYAGSDELAPLAAAPAGKPPIDFDNIVGRTVLVARRIDYNAATKDALAGGPLKLKFYTTDAAAAEPNEAIVPINVTARDEAEFLAASDQVIFKGDCLCTMPQADSTTQQDYVLSTPQLTVNLPRDKTKQSSASVDIFAAGPAELTFYVDDLAGSQTSANPLPAKVTAHKEAKFLSTLNQVVFEGDCLCTMNRDDPNVQQQYSLSAPKLTIDLPEDADNKSPASPAGIKHLNAAGGVVRLTSVRKAGDEVLGFTKLKCLQLDYDPARELLLATGPGLIEVDNSKIAKPKTDTPKFGLQKQCYAVIRYFDTLTYFLEANRIVADAENDRILIDYFPVVDGKYGKQVMATARHVEANFIQTPDGQTELSTLTAGGGVTYKEDIEFIGSQLFYDVNDAVMMVNGDQTWPCLLNGALVDAIKYDLKTGRADAVIVAPGTLEIKRPD